MCLRTVFHAGDVWVCSGQRCVRPLCVCYITLAVLCSTPLGHSRKHYCPFHISKRERERGAWCICSPPTFALSSQHADHSHCLGTCPTRCPPVGPCHLYSNMAFLLENAFNGSAMVVEADRFPLLRMFTSKKDMIASPTNEQPVVEEQWAVRPPPIIPPSPLPHTPSPPLPLPQEGLLRENQKECGTFTRPVSPAASIRLMCA